MRSNRINSRLNLSGVVNGIDNLIVPLVQLQHIAVKLNKRTQTAIDRDDREIVRFHFRFSSKKCLDRDPYFSDSPGFSGKI
jgi:hypothetical protein